MDRPTKESRVIMRMRKTFLSGRKLCTEAIKLERKDLDHVDLAVTRVQRAVIDLDSWTWRWAGPRVTSCKSASQWGCKFI